MSSGRELPAGAASRAAAERVLLDLQRRVGRRDPAFPARGAEDPGWVILEAFAEALAELEGEVGRLEERLLPRLIEALGEEPRGASAARAALVFAPEPGAEEPVRVPRGTVVVAARAAGGPRVAFETAAEAWTSPARLERVATRAGARTEEVFPWPQAGWDGELVRLFGGRTSLERQLYLGDPALLLLRESREAIVLEWAGLPQVLWEGAWEYSAAGGWRAAPVELEESRGAAGKRSARLRLSGPLPDVAERRIESSNGPWLRLSLPGGRHVSLPAPRWVEGPAGGGHDVPRPVARILSRGGERWEDHSLAAGKIVPAETTAEWDPAVYLGWDRPVPASVCFELSRPSVPAGWGDADPKRMPRVEWEVSAARGFRTVEVRDGTAGLTRSGCVSWDLPADWKPQEALGERLFWLRARWTSGEYLRAPEVRAVLPHAAEAVQVARREGVVLEVEADARGSAVLRLEDGEAEPFEALELRGPEGWLRLLREGVEKGGEAAGASAGRFRLRRLLRGGTAIESAALRPGPATVRLPSLSVTLGERGNVPAGSVTILEGPVTGVARALQPLAASGGLDPEAPENVRRRVLASWRTGGRAVTAADFRRLVPALDPEVARVEAAADPRAPWLVTVCVVADGQPGPGRLAPARLRWIEERLQEKAPLGTVVEVVEPRYVPVEVIVRCDEGVPPPPEGQRRRLEEELRGYLHPVRGGRDGAGFPHGTWLTSDEAAAIMARALAGERPAAGLGGSSWRPSRIEVRGPTPDAEAPRGSPLVIPLLERLSFEDLGR